MYEVRFVTDSPNKKTKDGEFGHIKGSLIVEVIADSPKEAVTNALALLFGHTLVISTVTKQTELSDWSTARSFRDLEITICTQKGA